MGLLIGKLNKHNKMNDDRYVFLVEWYDSAAALIRTYNLTFYLQDSTIDMVLLIVNEFDIKNKRTFLKRCEYPSVQINDIFLGAILNIYSRQLKVVDFADQFTRAKFEKQKGKTLALIKPDAYMSMGKIITMIQQSGFLINNMKMVKLSEQEVQKFYSQEKQKISKSISAYLSSDLMLALQIMAENCVNSWQSLMGSSNPQNAKKQNPQCIRAIFGQDQLKNAVHGSSTTHSSTKQLQFFFSNSSSLKCTAYFTSCSCLIIKPHIVAEGHVGQILDMVLSAGFQISALQMFWLDRAAAQEFLQVYKTILPEYNQMVEELTSGRCIAMEVRQNNAVAALRQLSGPSDPEMARSLRPKSIRAIFGKDKAKNAVHCTDLIEDALIEVEYFFTILQK